MNDFYLKVYDIVRLIPKGKVTTYGEIARFLGSKSSSRVVGYAMNSAHKFSDIPAHRVVNRNGILTGKHHFEHQNYMQEKLESEGIKVINDKIQNFENHFWKIDQE